MRSVISRSVVVFALCLAINLDWMVLQSIAWTTMLVTNATQTSSLAQAIVRTFDGHHPCDLCKRVSSAQQSQKKPEAQSAHGKPDLICAPRPIQVIFASQDFHYTEDAFDFFARGHSPPVPPPRAALA